MIAIFLPKRVDECRVRTAANVAIALLCMGIIVNAEPTPGMPQYQNRVQELTKTVASGPEGNPDAWYRSTVALGVLRETEAIPVLVANAWMRSTRSGTIPPSAPPGLPDYPAAVALMRIGLPSIDPLLLAYVKSDRSSLVPALVLTSMVPVESALRSLESFEREHADELDAEQTKRIQKLREAVSAVVRNGRAAPPPLEQEISRESAVAQRAKLIQATLAIVRATRNWTDADRSVLEAIETLGRLRASEATETLAPHVLSAIEAEEDGKSNLEMYPVAHALSKIGLPAVDPMLQQVIQGDEPEATRDVVARVLADMMPPEVAVTFVDAAIASQKNELAKQRLVDLREALNKLAEELKEKREKKDQP